MNPIKWAFNLGKKHHNYTYAPQSLIKYGKAYLKQSIKTRPQRIYQAKKNLQEAYKNILPTFNIGLGLYNTYQGNLRGLGQIARGLQYWQTTPKRRFRLNRYAQRRAYTPSRRYQYNRYYRSKRVPYWIWLRNKRRRKKYKRRYTTWNY